MDFFFAGHSQSTECDFHLPNENRMRKQKQQTRKRNKYICIQHNFALEQNDTQYTRAQASRGKKHSKSRVERVQCNNNIGSQSVSANKNIYIATIKRTTQHTRMYCYEIAWASEWTTEWNKRSEVKWTKKIVVVCRKKKRNINEGTARHNSHRV